MSKEVYFGKVRSKEKNQLVDFPLFSHRGKYYDFKLVKIFGEVLIQDSIGRYVPLSIKNAKKLGKLLK